MYDQIFKLLPLDYKINFVFNKKFCFLKITSIFSNIKIKTQLRYGCYLKPLATQDLPALQLRYWSI